jgi:hypothetical protein
VVVAFLSFRTFCYSIGFVVYRGVPYPTFVFDIPLCDVWSLTYVFYLWFALHCWSCLPWPRRGALDRINHIHVHALSSTFLAFRTGRRGHSRSIMGTHHPSLRPPANLSYVALIIITHSNHTRQDAVTPDSSHPPRCRVWLYARQTEKQAEIQEESTILCGTALLTGPQSAGCEWW